MGLSGEAKRLRVFTGESDKVNHVPLYEAIIREAKKAGLAGATAWRGIMSFGQSSHIRTAKILDLSADMPVIIEITDLEERINAFLPRLETLLEEANSGGLVTLEKVDIVKYAHKK